MSMVVLLKTETIEDIDEKLSAWSVARLETELAVKDILVEDIALEDMALEDIPAENIMVVLFRCREAEQRVSKQNPPGA